ncbi:MAG: hypothetical protein KIT50_13500 [Bacteroidetes bacterium]|nr:hypothetical protein [Bacteroidota bacterium]
MKTTIILITSFILIGCATMNTVRNGKDSGTAVVYETSKDNAYSYAMKILREVGGKVSDENAERGEIFGETGAEVGSYGSYIGIWIESVGENKTQVTVYTRRVLATQLTTGISESDFHKKFKLYLDNE